MQSGQEDIDSYQGEDLIFATGAPGSRWSASLQAISVNQTINVSDQREERTYARQIPRASGRIDTVGWHRGAYWGPSHDWGHNFDNLDKMTKAELVAEFKKPFGNYDGVKIIKSHWFSYHLDTLARLFPKAVIIGYYLPDQLCFDWWKLVGGWDISYPHYHWYEDDARMLKQIAIENQLLTKFMGEHGIAFKRLASLEEFITELGLDYVNCKFDGDIYKDKLNLAAYQAAGTGAPMVITKEQRVKMLEELITTTFTAVLNPTVNMNATAIDSISQLDADLISMTNNRINQYKREMENK
jgi:hypothetical protein